VIEVYAITDHPTPPLPPDKGLRALPVDGLAAICGSGAERGTGDVSPEALWRHEEVVEALMADRDLLPVRYGSRLPDEGALVRAVEVRQDELRAALGRVRGAVELSLRVMAGDEIRASDAGAETVGEGGHSSGTSERAGERPGRDGEGARYLRARARSSAARESIRAAVERPLAALARATAENPPGSPPELLRAAYLVDRKRVDVFTRAVARLQQAHPELRLLCTGPWPPYSFAER
jgi:Gas vesicle synthesis protein GvpL/GvpF